MELHEFSWKRMIEAVEIVREQAQRATTALHNAGSPTPSLETTPLDIGLPVSTEQLSAILRTSKF